MKEYMKLSALYYDISKPIGTSLDGDLEFYLEHIKDSNKVLEAGVGTGRLLIPFLKEGINIDGVDLSKEMLKVCKQKCQEHGVSTNLIEASVVDYKFDKYDAIIIPTGTFCLFPEIVKVLENFYTSLNDDGFILFDAVLPTDFIVGEQFTYGVRVDDKTELLLHDHRISIDWMRQKTVQRFDYELVKNNEIIETEVQDFVVNWYGIYEMYLLLESLGFTDIEIFGDYKKLDLDKTHSAITFKAYKKI